MLTSQFSTKTFPLIIAPAIFVTFHIVAVTFALGFFFGFSVAVLLIMYGPNGLRPNPHIYAVISFVINVIRSFPILILIVAISPFTRLIVGTVIGVKAAILPLSIAATAFVARLLENSFKEVDKQLIEAAKSFGASDLQIVFRVIVRESIPSIISIATLTIITYIAGSTVAGTVGAGGIGSVALNYGYNRFDNKVLYVSVFIIFIFVQVVQGLGNWLYKRIK